MTKKTIGVTGANGFLGSQIVKHFSDQGWNVIGLVRQPERHQKTSRITYKHYDLTEGISDDALAGVDFLIHAAYIQEFSDASDVLDVNIAGAQKLFDAAQKSRVKKCIFISSMSAHDKATSTYGKQKLQIEKLLNPTKDLVVRPGFIVGNGGIFQNTTQLMRRFHVLPTIGRGNQPLQIIGVQDLVRALELSIEKNLGGIITIAHPTVISYKTFYKAIAEHQKLHVLTLPVPYFVLSTALKIARTLRLKFGVTEDNLQGLRMLRSADTTPDIKRVGLKLPALHAYLQHLDIESDR